MAYHVDVTYCGLSVLAETHRCPTCGYHVGRANAVFGTAEKPQYRLHLSLTSDGFYLASKKFRELALAHNFIGVDFVPLENGRFVLKVARQVAYDLDWVNQEEWCTDCQNFRSNLTLVGSHPIAAHEAPIGAFEVVESVERWGQECGLRTAQHPDLIVGDGAGQVILTAKLPRVSLCVPGVIKRR